jgi:hypothetical protein
VNRNEFRFAFQALLFLGSHEGDSAGVVEISRATHAAAAGMAPGGD